MLDWLARQRAVFLRDDFYKRTMVLFKQFKNYTEGDPNLSVYRVRTVFREGLFGFSVIFAWKRELYRDLNVPVLPF
jgi:hypothetical protein